MHEGSDREAAGEEIGPALAAFATFGRDKEAVRMMFDCLLADLEPQNLIERLWVRDIATLTIRSGELRMVQATVHKLLMERAAGGLPSAQSDQAVLAGDGSDAGPTAIAPADEGIAGALARASIVMLERLVGLTYSQHLALFDGLSRLEGEVRKERDRVIGQFDKRRSQAVAAMIDALMEGHEAGEEAGEPA